MREMRYSGVKWIGYIPKSYIPYRLKNLLVKEKDSIRVGPFGSALKGSDILEEGDYWVYNQRVVLDSSFESNNTYINKEKYDELYSFRVKAGDILCTTRGSIGKITRVPDNYNEGVIHPCIIRFRIDDSIVNYKLLELIFNHSDIVIGQLKTASNATTIDVVYSDSLKNITIPLGTLEQQDKLLHFLIPKCTQIDAIIANAEQQIEKLKAYKQSIIGEAVTKGLNPETPMKDSGVQWIGEIPEHWKVVRGKAILRLLSRPIKQTDEVITCFRDGEVTLRKNRREEGFTISAKEIGYQGIEPNDLVIHGMDGFAGAIGISDSRGKASPVLLVCDSNQNKRYLAYYLRSLAYRDIFLALSTGIRVRSCDLRWNKISSLPMIVPSITEQQQIADYIDKKCEQIDRLIKIKQQKIGKLQQYKKSVIYEYVTGKKEV